MSNEDVHIEHKNEKMGRWLVDPKVDQAKIWPVWRKIAKYAQVSGNNTKTAKLFWRTLSIGEGDGFRNVSAGAKKVKELRYARKNGNRPFDTRLKDVPFDDYPSDYEKGRTDGLPEDDFEQCCPLANAKSKIEMNSTHVLISPTDMSHPIKFEIKNEQSEGCDNEYVFDRSRKKSRRAYFAEKSVGEADDSDVDIVSASQKVIKGSQLETDLADILLQINKKEI